MFGAFYCPELRGAGYSRPSKMCHLELPQLYPVTYERKVHDPLTAVIW